MYYGHLTLALVCCTSLQFSVILLNIWAQIARGLYWKGNDDFLAGLNKTVVLIPLPIDYSTSESKNSIKTSSGKVN